MKYIPLAQLLRYIINTMVNVILGYKDPEKEEVILELFEYKGGMLFFADVPLCSGSVSFTAPPFRACFTLENDSDLSRLRDKLIDYDNVEIVVKAFSDETKNRI